MTRWTAVWLVAATCASAPARADDPPLQALAIAHVGAGQGVFVDADDGTVLAAIAADRAVHPASVTKVATTLALLERLGPAHRFTTRFAATAPPGAGHIDADLVVHGGGDPFFVHESAFLVLRRLHALGVRHAAGLRVEGPFLFNWQPDPDGTRLRRALSGRDGASAWAGIGGGLRLGEAALAFGGPVRVAAASERTLVVHRSPPLLHVVKALNGFSNNVFHLAADAIGGAPALEAIVRANVPEALRPEITIDNGAGAGMTNRLSPRAAVAILRALDRRMHAIGQPITAVLPVSGVDPGTLEKRLLDRRRYVVGKTGTFGSVGACALVGLLRSPSRGTVAFAVLNHGVAVPEARRWQDAFVRALIEAVDAEPWPYDEPTRPAYMLALVE
jgi:D-alanyl-D-alanine carboxypeptidase/D-alanyl-D-alanine-endopeptidase (penicillin-binding protein 4)